MKDKITGKTEEIKGRVTGDRSEELKGKARQAKGRLQDAVNRAARDLDDAGRPTHRHDQGHA